MLISRTRSSQTQTVKAGRKIRYYICDRLVSGGRDPSAWRLPAEALEEAVSTPIIAI